MIVEECRKVWLSAVEMLEEIRIIWGGGFGQTSVARHRIELKYVTSALLAQKRIVHYREQRTQ